MTIGELIEKLKEYPPEFYVTVERDYFCFDVLNPDEIKAILWEVNRPHCYEDTPNDAYTSVTPNAIMFMND